VVDVLVAGVADCAIWCAGNIGEVEGLVAEVVG